MRWVCQPENPCDATALDVAHVGVAVARVGVAVLLSTAVPGGVAAAAVMDGLCHPRLCHRPPCDTPGSARERGQNVAVSPLTRDRGSVQVSCAMAAQEGTCVPRCGSQ